MTAETYAKYINLGFLPLYIDNEKRPLYKYASKDASYYTSIFPYCTGCLYGMIPPPYIVVLDVDIKNGQPGLQSLSQFELDYHCNLQQPNVTTQSQGRHYYCFVKNKGHALAKHHPKYPGIEFIHDTGDKNRFVVAGEQYLRGPYTLHTLQCVAGIDFWKSDGLRIRLPSHELDCKSDENAFTQMTSEQLSACLQWISPDEYDTWIKIGAIIRQEGVENGYQLYLNWSRQSDKFKSELEIQSKWASFNRKDAGVATLGSLIYFAKLGKLEALIHELHSTSLEDMLTKASDAEFSSKFISYPLLTPEFISEHYNSVSTKHSKTEDTKAIQKVITKATKASLSDDEGVNRFIRIVSILSKNCFYDILLHKFVDKTAVETELASTLQAHGVTINNAIRQGILPWADALEYNPSVHDKIYTSEGHRMVNLFNPKSLPNVAIAYSTQGKRDIEFLCTHWSLLLGSRSHVLFSFLALLCQNPGEKIGWMPIIQSIPGVGKSMLSTMISSHLLGYQNVGLATHLDLKGDYNSWGFDKVLVVIEELNTTGHEQYLIRNTLKTFVTNRHCRKVQKYLDNRTVLNLTNYIAFTNDKGALPPEKQERRFLTLECKVQSLSDLEYKIGIPRQEYFAKLYSISSPDYPHGGELKKFFTEFDIIDVNRNFIPNIE